MTCSFCPKPAISSYQVREGKLPDPYKAIDPKTNPDNSKLRVVRVCDDHKAQVPR